MADEAAAAKHNNEVGNIFDHKVDSSKSIVLCDRFSYIYIRQNMRSRSLYARYEHMYVLLTLSTTDKHHAINAKSI